MFIYSSLNWISSKTFNVNVPADGALRKQYLSFGGRLRSFAGTWVCPQKRNPWVHLFLVHVCDGFYLTLNPCLCHLDKYRLLLGSSVSKWFNIMFSSIRCTTGNTSLSGSASVTTRCLKRHLKALEHFCSSPCTRGLPLFLKLDLVSPSAIFPRYCR